MAVAKFKQCPDCAEQVRAAARICRFCGYSFASAMSGSVLSSAPDTTPAPSTPIAGRRLAVPRVNARVDFVPEWNDPIPSENGPLVLEPLPALPALPRSDPFSFGFGALLLIALVAVGFAAYALIGLPSPAPVTPTPNATISAPPPTADPAALAAQYQSFADVATFGYTEAADLYAQFTGSSASASTPTDLVSSLQTTSYALDSIAPASCFSTLYTQMISLDQAALSDAQALATAGPGADTGAIISHLGSDLSSWQTFINSQLTGNRCGAGSQSFPSTSSGSS
jgi:hypothetical protein